MERAWTGSALSTALLLPASLKVHYHVEYLHRIHCTGPP